MRLKNQLFKIRKVGGQNSDIKDVNSYLRAEPDFFPVSALRLHYTVIYMYIALSVFLIYCVKSCALILPFKKSVQKFLSAAKRIL